MNSVDPALQHAYMVSVLSCSLYSVIYLVCNDSLLAYYIRDARTYVLMFALSCVCFTLTCTGTTFLVDFSY